MFFVYKRVRQGLNRAAAQSAATKAPVGLLLARGSESVGMSAKDAVGTCPLSRLTATALPKGEPRTLRESPCLSLRERWHGASRDGEGKAAGGSSKLDLSVA